MDRDNGGNRNLCPIISRCAAMKSRDGSTLDVAQHVSTITFSISAITTIILMLPDNEMQRWKKRKHLAFLAKYSS
jgi:hypothetical protein